MLFRSEFQLHVLKSRKKSRNSMHSNYNFKKTQVKDLSVKLQTTVQPVFTGRKIAQEFPTCEPKPQLIDQRCVAHQFKSDQCDAGYIGYTRGLGVEYRGRGAFHPSILFVLVDGHRSKTSSVRKHYDDRHAGTVPDDLRNCFKVLKKCRNKFDCLVNEMLLIKQLRPCLKCYYDQKTILLFQSYVN